MFFCYHYQTHFSFFEKRLVWQTFEKPNEILKTQIEVAIKNLTDEGLAKDSPNDQIKDKMVGGEFVEGEDLAAQAKQLAEGAPETFLRSLKRILNDLREYKKTVKLATQDENFKKWVNKDSARKKKFDESITYLNTTSINIEVYNIKEANHTELLHSQAQLQELTVNYNVPILQKTKIQGTPLEALTVAEAKAIIDNPSLYESSKNLFESYKKRNKLIAELYNQRVPEEPKNPEKSKSVIFDEKKVAEYRIGDVKKQIVNLEYLKVARNKMIEAQEKAEADKKLKEQ